MAWIAFASVPTILVVMLAMGQLEARLLPTTPLRNVDDDGSAAASGDGARADAGAGAGGQMRAGAGRRAGAGPAASGLRWEVVVGPVEGREEART
jgi:hypothetical protein